MVCYASVVLYWSLVSGHVQRCTAALPLHTTRIGLRLLTFSVDWYDFVAMFTNAATFDVLSIDL